jgi:ParB-like chromosome segregation protein Spo0J
MVTAPLHLIECGSRIREVSPTHVAALVASIKSVGLLHPITVRPHSVLNCGRVVDGFKLVSGLHRLEALREMGETNIPVQILGLNELEAIVAECDENLCGTSLTTAERALFTRRRKEAYEALHPETKHGTNQHESSRQIGESSDRFTADAAAKTGKAERTIQRDAERGENIPEPILKEIAGTDLDKGVVLDRLKNADDPAAELDTIRAEKAAKKAAKKAERLLAEEEAKEAKKANAATDAVIRMTVEQEYAEWILRHVATSELDTLIAWIQTAKPAGIIAALRRKAA